MITNHFSIAHPCTQLLQIILYTDRAFLILFLHILHRLIRFTEIVDDRAVHKILVEWPLGLGHKLPVVLLNELRVGKFVALLQIFDLLPSVNASGVAYIAGQIHPVIRVLRPIHNEVVPNHNVCIINAKHIVALVESVSLSASSLLLSHIFVISRIQNLHCNHHFLALFHQGQVLEGAPNFGYLAP